MIVKLIMPSAGDMKLKNQEGGELDLVPIFYGNECMGPHIVVEDDNGKVTGRYKLKVKMDGKVELKRGQD